MDDNPDNNEQVSPTHQLCPSTKPKMDQMQWSRIRSNKVGVDDGVTNIDVGSEVERGNKSPMGGKLSAKLRASSGLSQFREVDFSDQVQGSGDKTKKKHIVVSDSLRGSGVINDKPDEGDTGDVDEGGTEDVDEGGTGDVDEGGTEDVDEGGTGDVDEGKSGAVVTDNEAGRENDQCEEEHSQTADVQLSSAEKGISVKDKGGVFAYGVVAQTLQGNGGVVGKRVVQVPKTLNLKEEFRAANHRRFSSSGASTSKCNLHGGISTASSATDATELSLESTREGTSVDDEEQTSKPKRPPFHQDDQVKPTLTPTSIAIYSAIQNDSSRMGTCVICTTALCTFIVTIVFAVALLVIPKSSSFKEDQAVRAAVVVTSTNNTSNGESRTPSVVAINSSKNTDIGTSRTSSIVATNTSSNKGRDALPAASVDVPSSDSDIKNASHAAALQANIITKILKVLFTPTFPSTPPTISNTLAPVSSISSESSTTPATPVTSTTLPAQKNTTQLFRSFIRTR
nr:uncharacterized protein LOC128700030 [Cherax quadricarinatus]